MGSSLTGTRSVVREHAPVQWIETWVVGSARVTHSRGSLVGEVAGRVRLSVWVRQIRARSTRRTTQGIGRLLWLEIWSATANVATPATKEARAATQVPPRGPRRPMPALGKRPSNQAMFEQAPSGELARSGRLGLTPAWLLTGNEFPQRLRRSVSCQHLRRRRSDRDGVGRRHQRQ
jgi:hypothetical protein